MRLLQALVAGLAIGVIVTAFRDFENERWLVPVSGGAGGGGGAGGVGADEDEPILGYDGMDVDTLLEWLDDADLDRDTLVDMRRYEERHLGRGVVLDAIDDLLDD